MGTVWIESGLRTVHSFHSACCNLSDSDPSSSMFESDLYRISPAGERKAPEYENACAERQVKTRHSLYVRQVLQECGCKGLLYFDHKVYEADGGGWS